MKKIILLLLCIMAFPFSVKAATYNSLDFRETLKAESIEEKFDSYKPDENAITIYLFRGKGCSHCKEFLEFMNSITEEYGKYFKMETYEVWKDSDNKALYKEVATYLEQESTGVPYIIIGERVYSGYSSKYADDIKDAIKKLYNTEKSKRYDIFDEMRSNPNKKEPISIAYILWAFGIMAVCSIAIIIYVNIKFKEVDNRLNEVAKVKSYKLKK